MSKNDVENIEAHKIGIKFSPPTLILIYELKDSKQLKKRLMPIRNFVQDSNIKITSENLKSRHAEKLSNVPNAQIEKMLRLLKDYNRGINLQTSLKMIQAQDNLFNFNQVEEEVTQSNADESEDSSAASYTNEEDVEELLEIPSDN